MSFGLATAMSAESVRVTTIYKQEVTYTAAWQDVTVQLSDVSV